LNIEPFFPKENQMKIIWTFKNDTGAVLVIVMLMLVILTLLGKTATTRSTVEMGIAANDGLSKKAFYTAESGLEHIKARLQTEFANKNRAKIASGQIPDWDFALNGSVEAVEAATDTDFDGAATWIKEQAQDDGGWFMGNYTVRAWNNPADRGGTSDDTDRLLCIRSVATGLRGTKSSVEVILLGQAFGEAVTGYFVQAGGGAGKNNNSRDVAAISDFTVQ
jgi:Tfp pilus assembly protein PilX